MEFLFYYIFNIVYRYSTRIRYTLDRKVIGSLFDSSLIYGSYTFFLVFNISEFLDHDKKLNLSVAAGCFIMIVNLLLGSVFCYKEQYAIEYLERIEQLQKRQKIAIYFFYISYLILALLFCYFKIYE